MSKFADKRILIFAPKFFGYEIEIVKKITSLGAKVDLFDERPSNSFLTKTLIRLGVSLIEQNIENYYRNIFSLIKDREYHFVVFLNPEAVRPNILSYYRKHFASATFILYMWDSAKNKQGIPEIKSFFDRKLSFDKKDVEKFSDFTFRPLFYIDDYGKLNEDNTQKEYEILFLGTAHSDRYLLSKNIENQLREWGYNGYMFYYLSSPILYWYNKFFNFKVFRKSAIREFSFISKSKEDVLDLYKKSTAILDIQHPDQTGLTMRTFEALGAGKKLLTTNIHVKEYDFFSEEYIFLIDRNDLKINKGAFEEFSTSSCTYSPAIRYKYSLEGWLMDVFYN